MMEILNYGYKYNDDPGWHLSIMPRRHARHEECMETKFHILYISVTGTPQLELLAWGSHHNSTGERSHNAWWNRRWWDRTTAQISWQTILPLPVTVPWISIPQPITCWMDNSSSIIYIQQDNFLHDFLWDFSKQQIYITGTCNLVVHKILSIFRQFYL